MVRCDGLGKQVLSIMPNRQIVYSGLWGILFCCHVTYLSVYKFNYGYNMAACVAAGMCLIGVHGYCNHATAGVLYSSVWVIWCIKVIPA